MVDVALIVVPDPEGSGTTFRMADPRKAAGSAFSKPEPFFYSDGSINLVCGSCGYVIGRSLNNASQLQEGVYECPSCGSFNATRA